MAIEKFPVTPAIRALRAAGITFTQHLYDYVEKGGTARAAAELGVDEHTVLKTLVVEDDARVPRIVVMHGDREVAVGVLARQLGVKRIAPCDPSTAHKYTGYLLGGTSPLGTRTALTVLVQRSVFDLHRVFLNGGKRGFLVALDPADLRRAVPLTEIDAAAPPG
jgi:Cys-tRNA(Pro) deacylase